MISASVETIENAAGRQKGAGRPALFDRPNWSADSAAARLFSPGDPAAGEAALRRACLRAAEERAGQCARALALLPAREQERAALLLTLTDALFATAAGPGTAEERVEDLDRIAFAIARALRSMQIEGSGDDSWLSHGWGEDFKGLDFSIPWRGGDQLQCVLLVGQHLH